MMNCCSEIVALTRSPMEMRPINWPPSITGKWRSRFSVKAPRNEQPARGLHPGRAVGHLTAA